MIIGARQIGKTYIIDEFCKNEYKKYCTINLLERADVIKLYESDNRTISFEEAFYMATLGSGEIFGKVGSFKPGYDFDALVIGDLQDSFMNLSPKELVERFCYSGEVSNIKYRYCRGKEI